MTQKTEKTAKTDPQRFRDMALLLRWENQLSNARLREIFGKGRLSVFRASQWLKEFRDAHPTWVLQGSVTRTLDASETFHRTAPETNDLDQYLALVGLPNAKDANSSQVVVAAFPDISPPDPRIFATLSVAARAGFLVEIEYRSMGNPDLHKRVIAPHSIVHAGRRWHARAFCEKNQQFRDYALGRMSRATLLNLPAGHRMDADKAWMTKVPVRLVPHPDLSYEQASVIRFEYFKETAARTTTCRAPLVQYFIQDVRAATDVAKQRPPEYQLAVENLKEVSPWLFPS